MKSGGFLSSCNRSLFKDGHVPVIATVALTQLLRVQKVKTMNAVDCSHQNYDAFVLLGNVHGQNRGLAEFVPHMVVGQCDVQTGLAKLQNIMRSAPENGKNGQMPAK